ncbi:Gfo/Idh/MocA family protein [Alienimonas chondri]|uniref:Inositol 2-dehydrogenase/D-chiro-inositol 3-dehydrogenase n=1 Tax=Alienimonas chondri TaxID=2681879 RepID=A0ABX1VHT8_9PLAN|nr:Gfo/Idh/MocA family oxidoreductase [Alienimonas chondri]NNJ26341.1 Inositol 2-dehydrogenase/D-chiro-inositol 3-dehydrogenase [Alienimonas chondri]
MKHAVEETARRATITRREFGGMLGLAGAVCGMSRASALGAQEAPTDADGNIIPGFEKTEDESTAPKSWRPVSDRKVKVGIAGYGLCKFGAAFFYQNHPNVEVAAATDLDPGRCAELAGAVGAKKTYPSCEEMIKDRSVEAVFIATDAPSHARLAIMALDHGKHVCSAVPAVFGFEAEDEAERLFKSVQRSGLKYMMNETSTFHEDLYAKRMQYRSGALGKIIYSEGEYWHDGVGALGSYNPKTGNIDPHGWRRALPPMWYPTHATAYYVSVTGGRFTEASGLGTESYYPVYKEGANQYQNAFGTEIAMLKTSEGGISRMGVSWDMKDAHGEQGRVYGEKPHDGNVDGSRPPLPPGVAGGGHGGSHGRLTNDFIESILLDRKPIVDIGDALNMTLAGTIAHQSALKHGEWMKIPQYDL